MKKRLVVSLLCAAMAASLASACGNTSQQADSASESESAQESGDEEESGEGAEEEKESEEESDGTEESKDTVKPAEKAEVESATAEQVQEFMKDSDENTVLVDARPQESYSGWALEGAANGGHLKNAALFSARWLDCEYAAAAPREAYLERAMEDQGITEGKEVIVYDYTGEQASDVAGYFIEQGIEDVLVFQADELIDAGKDLESYKNYDRFLPTEIVKSISDVKSGKEKELSE